MSEFKNYKICAPHSYTGGDGVEHTTWKEVGVIRWSDDKKFVQLNLVPGQTYMAFPFEKRGRETPLDQIDLSNDYPAN